MRKILLNDKIAKREKKLYEKFVKILSKNFSREKKKFKVFLNLKLANFVLN